MACWYKERLAKVGSATEEAGFLDYVRGIGHIDGNKEKGKSEIEISVEETDRG